MSEDTKEQATTHRTETVTITTRFRISGDIVNQATADLDDESRSAIRWLHAYGAENDMTLPELGAMIRYDGSTVHRVFTGKYQGSLPNVVAQIAQVMRLEEERRKGRKLDFIETDLARKIWRVCEATVEYQRMAFLFGDTQMGKTVALLKYRDDHNHGNTIYVRVPVGGALTNFVESLANTLRMGGQDNEKDRRKRIIKAFDGRMLLIVDEAHQCFTTGRAMKSARTMEFIREIHDESGCGVLICGTNVFRDEMETGAASGILKQCKRRRLVSLQLPPLPTRKDLDTFARAYGLEPAKDEALRLQTDVIRDEALGMWLTLLRMASKIASKRNQRMAWDHVLQAHAGLVELEGGKL